MDGGKQRVWLVVEDSDDDFFLFRRAAKCLTGRFEIQRAHDGFEAMEVLSYGQEKPVLVVSDLKMPRMGGLELLAWFERQDQLKTIPFVVLSSSRAEEDMRTARELGADDYLVKPSSLSVLETMIRELMKQQVECGSLDSET